MLEDPLIGQKLANYSIKKVIGRGGMAQVYYGWDESLARPVAIKIIDNRFRSNPVYAQRFVQEARSIATWRHEHILQVYFADQENGLYYFAMEYIDGLDLGQLMRQYADAGELIPHEDVLTISRAVADALDYAHQRGVIHRDIKPSNIMVAKDGRVVLADFGLALDTQQGSLGETFGTPHYIAPEQAVNSARAVPQSDLYALGVILYEMLTGVVPFDDPSPTSLALQHLTLPPPAPRTLNPDLNEATEAVLLKALSKQPADRYSSGRELIDALVSALAQKAESTSGRYSLPPLPGGITSAEPSRSHSPMSLREKGSLYPSPLLTPPLSTPDIPSKPVPALVATPSAGERPTSASMIVWQQPWVWIVGGVFVLIFLMGLVMAGVIALQAGRDEVTTTPLAQVGTVIGTTQRPTIESEITPHNTVATPQVIEPTPGQTEPTVITTVASSNEPPTAEPASPTANPVLPLPTVLYPNGHRMVLYYDDYSFYVFNPNADSIRVGSLDFEALDANDLPTGYYFSGQLWAQFYSFVEENGCVRMEVVRSPAFLRPNQCRNYNSTVTPAPEDDSIFWTVLGGNVAFRILWNDQEIGRCPVGANSCEIYLP